MAVSMSADGGTKAYSDPQPMSVSMTSYAADARTNAADADTTDARTNASDTSNPANATDATYTTGNTTSYRQRDSADRERCNPETFADDSHTRSSMIISPAMNSEPERHSRRSLTRARVIGRGIRSENDLGKL
jgi:hypothetical protein